MNVFDVNQGSYVKNVIIINIVLAAVNCLQFKIIIKVCLQLTKMILIKNS